MTAATLLWAPGTVIILRDGKSPGSGGGLMVMSRVEGADTLSPLEIVWMCSRAPRLGHLSRKLPSFAPGLNYLPQLALRC